MTRKKDALLTNAGSFFSACKKIISLTVSLLLTINVLGIESFKVIADGSFSGYNENLISMTSSDWLTNGASFNGSDIEMSDQSEGDSGLAMYYIDVSSISDAISNEMLEISFSMSSYIAADEEADVCTIQIAFSSSDSTDDAISTVSLERGTGSLGSAVSLTSGASIPAGTKYIIITLTSVQVGSTNSAVFSGGSLSINDSQAPTLTASYTTEWTNSDIEVTVTASDNDSGIEGIYDSDSYELITSDSTYTFTVSENSSYSFFAQDYAEYMSDTLDISITNIDKNAPTETLTIALSDESWSSSAVTFTLSDFTAATGESSEVRQYKIGDGEWTQYEGEVTVSSEGENTIYARIIDEAGNTSDVATATAYVDTQAPVFSTLTYEASQSGGATITAEASDSASGVAVTKWIEGSAEASEFSESGTEYTDSFTVTNGGTYTVYAKDNTGNETVETITVNTYPTVSSIGSKELDEDDDLEVVFSVSDYESANGELTVTAVSSDTDLIPNPSCVNTDGSVTLTISPSADQWGGPVTITVTVSDGSLSVSESFDVTVNSVNDIPVANDDSAEVDEDGSVTIDVLNNDNDAEASEITISSLGTPAHGTATLSSDSKSVIYTPSDDYNGTDSFTYTVSDESDTSSAATVTVTINEINDAPSAKNDSATTTEDTPVTIDVTSNDVDYDLDTTDDETLTVISFTSPSNGTAEISDNNIIYTPSLNWYGTDSFTYTINDRNGVESTATVTVTVESYDDEPEFSGLSETYSMDEDGTDYVITFEISDTETSVQNLMFQISSSNEDLVENSNIVISGLSDTDPATTVTITPTANESGQTTLTFKVGDGFSVTTFTAVLTVNAVNDSPSAASDTLYYTEDATLTIDMDDLVDNDTDIDGDTLYFLSVDSLPSSGTLVEADSENNIWTYTPPENFTDSVTFTYTVSDSQATSTGTVTLVANKINDAPTLEFDSDNVYECDEDKTSEELYFTIDDIETSQDDLILAVGSSNETIVSSDQITVNHGENGECSLVIVPNGDQNGTITVSVTVSDGLKLTTDTFEFIVNAVQDAPVAEDDSYSVVESGSVSFNPTSNDRDADEDSIYITEYTSPSNGTVSLSGSVFTYAPNAGYTGSDSFTYTISDGNDTATGTVTITVEGFSNAPEIEPLANQRVNEDETTDALSFTVSDDDAGDTFTVTAVSSDTSLVLNTDESIAISDLGSGSYTITLTPEANQYGSCEITITVEDSAGYTDSTTFTLYVVPINDDPVAGDISIETDEDTDSATIDLLSEASDIETDTSDLEVVEITQPSNGRVTQDDSLNYYYIPDDDYNGSDSFQYTITDGESTATATVYVTVNLVNDAPVAENNWKELPNNVSETATINVLANDYDNHDSDTLYTYEIVSGPTYGTAEINSDGTITYTRTEVSPNDNGTDQFVYRIIDREDPDAEDVLSDTATVYIGVDFNSSVNAYNITLTKKEDCGSFYISLSISNPTGNDLTITTSTPTLGTVDEIDATNKTLLFSPTLNAYGTETISYTVSDGVSSDTAYIYLTVYPVNDAPDFITYPDSVTFDEDTIAGTTETTGVLEVTYDDVDVEDNVEDIIFNVMATPDSGEEIVIADEDISVTYTETGVTFTITPLQDMYGTGTLRLSASDGLVESYVYIPYTVTPVNDAPYAPDYYKTLQEDTSISIDLIHANSDVDGDTLTLTIQSGDEPANGSVTISDDTAVYTPDDDFNGSDSFVYTLSDSNGGVSTGTVYLTVNNVNDAPAISSISYYNSTLEDIVLDVPFTASDVDGDELSLTFSSDNTTVVPVDNITYTIDGDTITLTITPAENKFGTAVITADIYDGTDTVVQSLQVVVKSVNDTPVAVDDAYTINEDTVTVLTPLSNDSDVEDTSLEIFELGDTVNGGTVVGNGDGTVTYTPPENYYGEDSFTYIISDDHDAHAEATVTVTIESVNDAPNAVNDSASTQEDVAVTIDILGNDSDVDGDLLTILDISASTLSATITDNGDGTVSYTPYENASGTDTFTYTVSDGQAENSTSTATVTVVISPVNDPPDAVKNSSYSGDWEFDEDTVGEFGIDVSDVETSAENLIVTITSSNQSLVPDTAIVLSGTTENKIVSLTPVSNQSGTLVLTVEISDGVNTTLRYFDVTVNPVNDQPTITQSDIETNEDTAVSSSASSTDVETDTSSLVFTHDTSADGPSYGSVTVNSDGSWTYTPDENYNGTDSFTIMVDDGSGDANSTNSTVVNIKIAAVNDAPTADGETAETDEDTPVTIDILDGDTDVDTDTDLNQDEDYDPSSEVLSIKEDGFLYVDNGEVTISDGKIIFTPDENWSGIETFTYTLVDTLGAEDLGVVTITVNAVNDAPTVGVNTGMTLNEGATETITSEMLEDGDPDDDGTEIIYTITSATQNGTLYLSGTALTEDDQFTQEDIDSSLITYTHDGSETTSDSFGFTVSDGGEDGSSSVSDTFSITVVEVNDAPQISEISDVTIDEDGTTSAISFTVTDIDSEDDQLTVTAVSDNTVLVVPADNITISDGDGTSRTITIVPAADKNGSAEITLTVSDAAEEGEENGKTASTSFTITVNAVDDAPSAQDDEYTIYENDSFGLVDVTSNDDADYLMEGDTLTIVSIDSHSPAIGTSSIVQDEDDSDRDKIKFVPDADWEYSTQQEVTIEYTMQDENGDQSSATLTVIVIPENDNPTITDIEDQSIDEDTSSSDISFTVADEEDEDSSLTITKASSDTALVPEDNITITQVSGGEYTVTVTPLADQNGIVTITLTVTDSEEATAEETFTVTVNPVNDAPSGGDDTILINEDTETVMDMLLDNDDTDETTNGDLEDLSIVSITSPSYGTAVLAEDGKSVTYTPTENYYGDDSAGDTSYDDDSFTYTVRDAENEENTFTVYIEIEPVNDAPVITATFGDQNINEGEASSTLSFTVTDVDDDDEDLTVTGVSSKQLFIKSSDIDITNLGGSDRTVQVTPNGKWNGVTTITLTVSDDDGLYDETESVYSFTVTIGAVNEAPVANDDTLDADEDTLTTLDVLDNDTDGDLATNPDEEALTIISIDSVDTSVCTVSIINEGTALSIMGVGNWNGETTFNYTISDSEGAESTASVTVLINQVNDDPVAVDKEGSADEDNSAVIDVVTDATDIDKDTDLNNDTSYLPADEILSVDADGFSGVDNGTASVNSSGDIVFTPDDDWHGTETFTYTLIDSNGGSDTAEITVTISAVNDLPSAEDDSFTYDEDSVSSGVMLDVLSNDTDADLESGVDTEELTIISVDDTSLPDEISIAISGNYIQITAASNWNGLAEFSYTISDSSGEESYADVTVTINQINDAPEAANDTAACNEDSSVTIDVLANDTDIDQDTDLNNDSGYPPADELLSVDETGFTGVDNGTVSVDSNGDVVFTPNADWYGIEMFGYVVNDSNGGSDTGYVTVTVNAVNDQLSVSTNTGMTLNEGASKTVTDSMLDVSDVDDSGSDIIYELTDPPLLGTMYLSGEELGEYSTFTQADIDAGNISYTHDGSETTSDVIGMLVYDGGEDGTTSVGIEFEFTILPVNDPPVLVYNNELTVDEGDEGSITASFLSHSDVDNTDSELEYEITANVSYGTLYNDGTALSAGDTFTQQDIEDGLISYKNDGGEESEDSFKFTLSDNDVSLDENTFTIEVTAVNDQLSVSTNTGMTLNEGASKTVTDSMLDISDVDDSGTGITYEVEDVPQNGTLYLNGEALGENSTFTQADIDAGNISYTHDGSETTSDEISFTVYDGGEDGTDEVSFTFEITVLPVNDPPVLVYNNELTVDEGDEGIITDSLLSHSDADNTDSELEYEITSNVSSGTLYKDGTALSSGDTFTQQDIEDGLISYKNDGGEESEDSFKFILSDNDVSLDENTFTIEVTAVNDQLSVSTNTGMTLNEGASKTVTDSMLDVSDVDDSGTGITYEVEDVPQNGTLYLNGEALGENSTFTQTDIDAGNISYTHDGSETTSDEISFTVYDGGEDGTDEVSFTFEITVLPVNDPPVVVKNNKLNVDEGEEVSITVALLNHSDADNTSDELTYEITSNVSSGTLYKDGSVLAVGDTFTQKDIEDGLISYKNDGSEATSDSFKFTLSDNDATLDENTFLIGIAYVNDAPEIDKNQGMTLNEGATKALDDTMLKSSDVDNEDDELTYEITEYVENGKLYLNDKELKLGDTFTQQDIADGLVTYTHNGSETISDSFKFEMTDKAGDDTQIGTFAITITPVNDAPSTPSVVTPTSSDYYKDGQKVHVTWTQSTDAEDDSITYKLEFYDGDSWTTLVESTSALEYYHELVSTDLHTDEASYRVTAYDGKLYSDSDTGDSFIIDNNAPEDVTVTLKDNSGSTIEEDSWAKGAKITVSGGTDLLEISYYISIDGDTAYEVAAGEVTKITSSGEHTVTVYANDLLDNEAEVGTYTFKVDTLSPLEPDITYSPSSYTDGKVKLSFDFNTDPGGSGNDTITLPSGVEKDVSDSVTWTATANGTYTMTITDVAGNETEFSVTIDWIDTSTPKISLDQNGYDLGTWTNQDISADLIYHDSDSGLSLKQYYIGKSSTASASWSDYVASVEFDEDGIYYLYGYAKDNAGNTVKEIFGEFKLDKTAPILNVTLNDDGTYTITCTDALSGLKSIEFASGTTLSLSETQIWVPEESGDYEIIAQDYAGNETSVTLTVVIEEAEEDIIAPEITSEDVELDEKNETADITIKASDIGTGVEKIILETGEVFYGAEILLTDIPYGPLTIQVVDKAGNVTEYTIIVGPETGDDGSKFTKQDIALISWLGLVALLLLLIAFSWNVKVTLYGYDEQGKYKQKTIKMLKLRRKNNEKELDVTVNNRKHLNLHSATILLRKGLTKKMKTKTVKFTVKDVNGIDVLVPEDTEGKFEYTHYNR